MAPPPPIAPEYGPSSQLPLLGHSSVEQSFGSDAKPSKSTLYSPTKPTTTPTKSEVKSEDTLSAGNKGKLVNERNISRHMSNEILWSIDRLLMGILKFS